MWRDEMKFYATLRVSGEMDAPDIEYIIRHLTLEHLTEINDIEYEDIEVIEE